MVFLGSTEMRRSTRSFVDKVLRSGKRMFADRHYEEVKRTRMISVDCVDTQGKKIKLLDCGMEIDDDVQTESFNLGKLKKDLNVNGTDEVLGIDERKRGLKSRELNETGLVVDNIYDGDNASRFGFVYTRKRKMTGLTDSSLKLNSFDEIHGSDKMYEQKKKKVIINSESGFNGNSVLNTGPIVFAASCSYRSDDNNGSIYRFSCFVSSVLRYLRMTELFSWRKFYSFLLIEPISSVYSSIGSRFLQDSTCTSNHALFKVFDSVQSIPVFTINFSSLHFYFMYIHSNLLLKHVFLSYSSLKHLINKNATTYDLKMPSNGTLKWDPPIDKLVVAKKARSARKRIPKVSLFNNLFQINTLENVENNKIIVSVPGVKEIVGYLDEDYVPFMLPELYIRSKGDEVSRTLEKSYPIYDMDSDDEQWLKKFKHECVSEDVFEKIIGAFERGIYCSPHDYSEVKLAVDRCLELASNEVLEDVYSYWMIKRKKKRSALIKVFQCYKQKRVKRHFASAVIRKKRSFGRRVIQHFAEKKFRFKKAMLNDEKLLKDSTNTYIKLHETQEAAKRSEEVLINKRKQAQALMEAADVAVYKATMALKIAEALAAGGSVNQVTGATFGSSFMDH